MLTLVARSRIIETETSPIVPVPDVTHDKDAIERIRLLAAAYGLAVRGGFEIRGSDDVPAQASGRAYAALLLFGQTGSAVWEYFAESSEYADGLANPMDRWSFRVGRWLAGELGGRALFPFEGPPWHPFGQWAQRAENVLPSPLGILMHPRFGLWHAYRFAVALPERIDGFEEFETHGNDSHACDSCAHKPCLQSCPVNAFTDDGYDVASCAAYLQENKHSDCHKLGCLARDACPEGSLAAYLPAHRQFHMRQFHASLKKASGK